MDANRVEIMKIIRIRMIWGNIASHKYTKAKSTQNFGGKDYQTQTDFLNIEINFLVHSLDDLDCWACLLLLILDA